MNSPSIREVIARHRKQLMTLPGVVGISATSHPSRAGEMGIVVYVKSGERPAGIPDSLEGYEVSTEVSSGFNAT